MTTDWLKEREQFAAMELTYQADVMPGDQVHDDSGGDKHSAEPPRDARGRWGVSVIDKLELLQK